MRTARGESDEETLRKCLPISSYDLFGISRVCKHTSDLACLTIAAEEPLLFLYYPVPGLHYLESLSQRMYFPVKPVTVGELAALYGMLSCAFREVVDRGNFSYVTEKEARHYHGACQAVFQAKAQAHELVAVPNFDNTTALAMAVSLPPCT